MTSKFFVDIIVNESEWITYMYSDFPKGIFSPKKRGLQIPNKPLLKNIRRI